MYFSLPRKIYGVADWAALDPGHSLPLPLALRGDIIALESAPQAASLLIQQENPTPGRVGQGKVLGSRDNRNSLKCSHLLSDLTFRKGKSCASDLRKAHTCACMCLCMCIFVCVCVCVRACICVSEVTVEGSDQVICRKIASPYYEVEKLGSPNPTLQPPKDPTCYCSHAECVVGWPLLVGMG